ncbi:MAG: DUF2437 domain-containing protein [Verrucomicrobia bacterium]|nr:DUF2437 domain-containing protein [Verrucomicrobiota bacterium]
MKPRSPLPHLRAGRVLALVLALCAASLPGGAAEAKLTRLVRFQAADTVGYGIVEGDQVRRIRGDIFGTWRATDQRLPLAKVRVLVPTQPTKVLAAALNYRSHQTTLAERPLPQHPEFFFKPPSCLIADGEDIVLPAGSTDVHYEAELVIVMGRRAKNVARERAAEYILGVTCGNDVSARDWQSGDIQWWRAKGADTFGPCGPVIVAGLNYDDLLLRLRVNGEVRQEQRTRDLLQNVAALVSFASQHVTLEPGDLIFTGTPGQTAALKPGDVVEVELEGVGILKNRVVAQAGR